MKRLSNLLAALVFASLVIFMSCGGGDDPAPPSAGEEAKDLIEGSWNVSGSPTFGGGIEGDWTGFTLTVSGFSAGTDGVWGGSYSVSGIPAGYGQVWGGDATATSASGSWTFASATNVSSVVTGDGVSIVLGTDTNAASLSTSFTVPSSLANGIFDEQWVFQFTK